ncbi:MAG: RNA 2',3'-cyclic phosphodiesterase [Candidatus Sulfotelmatobacter sp.]
MRLFVALDLDDDIRGRISRYLDDMRGFAPEARWVRPEALHVTLKFIGEKAVDEAKKIKRSLGTIRAEAFDLNIGGYGFFPGARAPQVFWIGIEGGPQLASLAATVDGNLAALSIPKEEHAFNPHLTLARGSRGSERRNRGKIDGSPHRFHRLQEKLAALPAPEFGTMTAREFFLYLSEPLPGGSRYTKLAGFALH